MFRRITATVLFACMLLSAAACAAVPDAAGESVTTAAETAQTSQGPHSSVPEELRYDGKTFTTACSDYNQYHFSIVEEMNGDVLNDAMYNMALAAENRLGVDIVEMSFDAYELPQKIKDMVFAGDTTFDAVTSLDRFTVDMMLAKVLMPMQKSKYIDLTAPYWNPQMAGELSLGDDTYYAVSSYNILTYVYTSCIYFNIDLLESFGKQSSELYALVDGGTWTFDRMMDYTAGVTSDLNGDDKFGDDDRFGLTSYDWNVFGNTMLAAGSEHALSKDADNLPALRWDDERYSLVAEKTYNIMNSDDAWSKATRFTAVPFQSGNALFMAGYFYAVSALAEMKDDYGIIPAPKYDEAQDDYYSETYDTMYTAIPLSAADIDFSGAVLEELSFNGYMNVTDAYIESTLKYKKSRDEKSIEMIQKCFDTRVVDLGSVYMFDYIGYDKLYVDLFSKSSFKLSSYIASNSKKADSRLSEILETAGIASKG